jgi:hypothetical protein
MQHSSSKLLPRAKNFGAGKITPQWCSVVVRTLRPYLLPSLFARSGHASGFFLAKKLASAVKRLACDRG